MLFWRQKFILFYFLSFGNVESRAIFFFTNDDEKDKEKKKKDKDRQKTRTKFIEVIVTNQEILIDDDDERPTVFMNRSKQS